MIKSLLRILLLGLLLGSTTLAFADVTLKSDHPDTYYVKDGDTLWSIASKFLKEPWQWPQIWQNNQQIPNPHLIYPGDVLHLSIVNGQPQLTVERGESGKVADQTAAASNQAYPTVKLSPKVEVQSIKAAIPAVSLDAIQAFLMDGQVVSNEEIKQAPYLLGGEDSREIWGQGDVIYVRDPIHHWQGDATDNVNIFHVGERYVDPDTKEVLGYEALQVGHLKLLSVKGDIATFRIISSRRGLQVGDRVLPTLRHEQLASYFPDAPSKAIKGRIIRLFGAVQSVARNDVVVINKGTRDGLKEGNLLEIRKPGDVVKDDQMQQFVQLPSQKAGAMLLFRVFDKVSYGLIMESLLPISMDDQVVTPE